ncbi:MAG: 5-formyltetrahydrofolate cyclo-ligase [Candidatus Saccharimonadales bacterium]
MYKQTIRRRGIIYRTSLTPESVRVKSAHMNQQLNEILNTLPEPYLTYTALLPGELNPASAFIDRDAIFIEPTRQAPMPNLLYSTIVIPMVAADRHGNRIGMGGGWFDTFLITQPQAILVGCCYDRMILDRITSESHDVRVDYICTETTTIVCTVE